MTSNRSEQVMNLVTNQAQQLSSAISKITNPALKSGGAVTTIASIGAWGYLISTPGTYQLAGDITWTPDNPLLCSAIVIACDNVVLDLNGFTITATGQYSSVAHGVAIVNLLSTYSGITIQNGTLANMGLSGVWAMNTNSLTITGITVSGLNYSGFTNLPSGILLLKCGTVSISNCFVESGNVTAMLGAGFTLLSCTGGTLTNCAVKNLTNNDGVSTGYFYAGSSQIAATNCSVTNLNTFYNASPDSKIGHTCIGFMPTESNNLTFTGCSASNIIGCCDDCHGMSLFGVDTATVSYFTANNVVDGDCPQMTGAKATGLEVYGNNIQVSDCSVSHIIAIVPQDLQSTGFSVCGSNNTLTNCVATDVQVWNAQKQPDTTCGYGNGFGWAPDPRPAFVNAANKTTYNNCVANDCQFGFDTFYHTNSNWVNPVTNNCGTAILNQANGFVRNYQMNFCSELPNSTPGSPAQTFPIKNCAAGNSF